MTLKTWTQKISHRSKLSNSKLSNSKLSSSSIPKSAYIVSIIVGLLTLLAYSGSRLVFAPVPWPDGSAFYLPGLEFISWPPVWRMHSQAAFVPSYDQANFNLMPALPALLGVIEKIGLTHLFSAPLLIKIISLCAQILWAWILWKGCLDFLVRARIKKTESLWISSWIALAALWDPIVRWGTLVVRTETWVALCWMMIVRQLWENPKTINRSSTLWKISAILALSAYFHFEAIILVPAVMIAVLPSHLSSFGIVWSKALFHIGARTLFFLSPWVLYVLTHFSLFIKQMETQFFRLSGSNHWISTPYLLFHSLFLEQGSPVGLPKFFNISKGIFWLVILFLILFLALDLIKLGLSQAKLWRINHTSYFSTAPSYFSTAQWATATGFIGSFYLWCSKAEVWFVGLCHLMFWPWLATHILEAYATQRNRTARLLTGLCVFYAGSSLVASSIQSQQIQPIYNWTEYQNWVSCIDRQIQMSPNKEAPRIWQPHVPDILVELSSRHPSYDLTRTLDFNQLEEFAWQSLKKFDVLILTEFFDRFTDDGPLDYDGASRSTDTEVQLKVPFGKWSLTRLPIEQSSAWSTHVCQYGPFWASVLVRSPRSF